jgi:polysaccharide biosynthesis/export protein
MVGIVMVSMLSRPLGAQDPQSRQPSSSVGRLTSAQQQQILARLRQSGLTRDQVRQRLKAAGYDPNLADRYFDEISRPDSSAAGSTASRYTRPIPPPTNSLIGALRRIGVLMPDDSLSSVPERTDTLRQSARPKRVEPAKPQVFGYELFKASTQFEPVMNGPVDGSYRLGPGDELTLVVTGDVEFAYDLQVTREGYLIVPDVGQVLVNGLTLEEAKRRLNERLGRVYSGVQVGSTQADVTVGKVRSKLVYVIGDVEVPGAYPLSGTATVFAALYRAGGPALTGSFRTIEVRRGNRVLQTVDIYDYLLRGDKATDVVLEQGDVVFVPVVGPQVTVLGGVRRPAIFELKGSEGLGDVMRFAGGAEADAAVERIQIDRILPADQRQPGRERVLVDVKLADVAKGVTMQDGDRVRVSRISDVRRNRVVVAGDVQRPGEYEFRAGMTALDLITNAMGLLPSAYTPAAHIVRLNPADSSTTMVRVVLDDKASSDYAGKIRLEDLDELAIFGRAALGHPKRFEVFGFVKNEGLYTFSEGMTVKDAVLLAGGFQEGASDGNVEVARRVRSVEGRDTMAIIHRVRVDLNPSPDAKGSDSGDFKLSDGDQVFIRRSPGFEPLRTIEVGGEVLYPGIYTVRTRLERVTDIIKRAGGLTDEAYARGFRLFRDGKPLGVDLPKALKKPGSTQDVVIEPGDRIEVPRFDPTVLVTGAVAFETRVRYQRGLSMEDYIDRAGGVAENGAVKKASVRYPNGELRTVKRLLGVSNSPDVEPGSTITVPTETNNSGFDWDKFVGRTLTVLSSLATIVLTVRAID